MSKRTIQSEISSSGVKAEQDRQPKYNAVTGGPNKLWLRKKRQFGGLICPPLGFVPEAVQKSDGHDPESR